METGVKRRPVEKCMDWCMYVCRGVGHKWCRFYSTSLSSRKWSLINFKKPYRQPSQLQYLVIFSKVGRIYHLATPQTEPFSSSFYLCFKTSPNAKPFTWKWVSLPSSFSCKSSSISFKWFCTWNRFETEVKNNSEMAYLISKIVLWVICSWRHRLYASFSEEFKHEVKQPGAEFIILENDHLKVEFDSLRGLLKVRVTHIGIMLSLSSCLKHFILLGRGGLVKKKMQKVCRRKKSATFPLVFFLWKLM